MDDESFKNKMKIMSSKDNRDKWNYTLNSEKENIECFKKHDPVLAILLDIWVKASEALMGYVNIKYSSIEEVETPKRKITLGDIKIN